MSSKSFEKSSIGESMDNLRDLVRSCLNKFKKEVKEKLSPSTISDEMFEYLLSLEGSQSFVAQIHKKNFWENFVTWPYGMVYKYIDNNGRALKTPLKFKNWEKVSPEWAKKNARFYYNLRAKERKDLLSSKWYLYTQNMLDALVSASSGTKKSVDRLKNFVMLNWNKWIDFICDFLVDFATKDQNNKTQNWLVFRRLFEADWFRWIKNSIDYYRKNYNPTTKKKKTAK